MVVQLGWDHHRYPASSASCITVDQPSAGLVADLKQRGMLDDTLVIFGTEFGRTSFAQGALKGDYGRDHQRQLQRLAGGGRYRRPRSTARPTTSATTSSKIRYIHDFNATILRTLGIDHTKLTYRAQGRDFRLTDVFGKVVPASSRSSAVFETHDAAQRRGPLRLRCFRPYDSSAGDASMKLRSGRVCRPPRCPASSATRLPSRRRLGRRSSRRSSASAMPRTPGARTFGCSALASCSSPCQTFPGRCSR